MEFCDSLTLDAILEVDTYPEVDDAQRVPLLRNLAAALNPKGRIGVINYKPGAGGPGLAPSPLFEDLILKT